MGKRQATALFKAAKNCKYCNHTFGLLETKYMIDNNVFCETCETATNQKPVAGTIHNWLVLNNRIVGTLVEDSLGRFEPGIDIVTSAILKLDEENNFVETKNTIYKLGVKN